MRQLMHYSPRGSWLHRCSPLAKLAFAAVLAFGVALAYNIISLAALFSALIMCSVRVAGLPRMRPLLRFLLLMMLVIMPSQAMFYWRVYQGLVEPDIYIIPPSALARVPVIGGVLLWLTQGHGLFVSLEGAKYGLLVFLKLACTALAGYLVAVSTRPGDLVIAVASLGMPPDLAMLAALAIGALPTLVEEASLAIRILRMRGLWRARAPLASIKAALRVLVTNIYARSYEIGVAMELKGLRCASRPARRVALALDDLLLILLAILGALLAVAGP